MNYLRIFTGADGQSHFEDVEMELTEAEFIPGEPPVWSSATFWRGNAAPVMVPAGWGGGRHVAPTKVLAVITKGEVEFEAGGEKRRLGAGTILLFEDTTGSGHYARVVGKEDWESLVMAVEG